MQKQIVRTDNLKGRRGRLPSKAKFPINVASNSPSIEFIRPLLEKLIKNYPTLKVIDSSASLNSLLQSFLSHLK